MDDFQLLVANVFNELAKDTISFKNVIDILQDKELRLHKQYTKLLYDAASNDKKVNAIKKQSYERNLEIIKGQKERWRKSYNQRKAINSILKIHNYIVDQNDINYILNGEKED